MIRRCIIVDNVLLDMRTKNPLFTVIHVYSSICSKW